MNRETLDQWLEWSISGLVLAILVLMPLAFGGRPQAPTGTLFDPVLLEPFLLAEWLCMPLLLLWMARLWLIPRPRLLWPPVCWVVLAFLAYAIYRYFTSDIEYVARQEVAHVIVYAFLFFVLINNLHGQETTQFVGFTLIFLAMCLSFYAVYQFVLGSDRVWHVLKPYPKRGSGTYICPNHLGGLLEMVLPLALAFVLVGRFKPVTKIILAYAVLTLCAGIVVTMSRGTWIAAACALLGLFTLLLLERNHRLPAFLALAVLVAGALFILPKSYHFQSRLKQIYTDGKVDDDARFDLWRPALKIWQDNLWVGAGPGHFDYRFGKYRPETVQARPDRAHNDFLNALADWGLVGTGLVFLALGLTAFGVVKTWPHVKKIPRDIGGKANSTKFAFVLGAFLALTAILVHSLVDFNMHIPANALVAVTFLALLGSHLRFASSDYWVALGIPLKLLASVILLGGVYTLGWHSSRRAAENVWLARAGRAEIFSTDQISLFKKAFAVEPNNFETADSIAEAYRRQAAASPPDSQELAQQALDWFGKALKLNPWDAGTTWRYGWCLDWLDRRSESPPYFTKAEQLDGNNYFILANVGIHYLFLENPVAARKYFERSLLLKPTNNEIARNYLAIVHERLTEAARRLGEGNKTSAKL
jgi:O-antigen ligase